MSISTHQLRRVLPWSVVFTQDQSPNFNATCTVVVPARDQDEAIACARGMAAWMGHPWTRTAPLAKAEPSHYLDLATLADQIHSVSSYNKWLPQ